MRPNSHISVEIDETDMGVASEKLSIDMEHDSNHTRGSKGTRCLDEDIIGYVTESLHREDEFSFLRLEFLQRINIMNHEVTLVRMKSQLQANAQASPTQLEGLAVALRDYTTAIRDYQFVHQHTTRLDKTASPDRKLLLQAYFMQPTDHNDPYEDTYLLLSPSHRSTSSLDSLRTFLLRNLPVQFTYTASEKRLRSNDYREGKPPQNLSPAVDGLLRFAVSFVGGAFVVIPMLIMSFNQSNVKSLITVSASVTLFGLVVSLGIRVSSIETLVATATYAAVLVVFVGSTSGNGVN